MAHSNESKENDLTPPKKRRRLNENSNSTPQDKSPNKQSSPVDVTPISVQNCQEILETALEEIKVSGDVTTSGIATQLPICFGLTINGLGNISFPLSDREARALIDVCEKAPYGKGLETETDENVRKSYQLDAKQFKFTHPKWNRGIKRLTSQIASELGCPINNDNKHGKKSGRVVAHCYKLLIYEKDGHFVDHRDNEKLPGMFATLIVQLPSIFKTKDNKAPLIVKHKNDEFKHYFGTNVNGNIDDDENSCKYNIYYASHYCDLLHKVNPIESGYRVVITYNLCWKGKTSLLPNITQMENEIWQLGNILKKWIANDAITGYRMIGIALEHLYTQRELSGSGVNALKGVDFDRIHTLKKAIDLIQDEGQEIAMCICDFEREVEEIGGPSYNSWYGYDPGDYDSYDWDIDTDTLRLGCELFYDADGHKMEEINRKSIDFELEEHCINFGDDNEWRWEKVDQTHEGYLGNGNATQNTTYKRVVVLIWKKGHEFERKIATGGIKAGIKALNKMIEKHEQDEKTQSKNKESNTNSNDNCNDHGKNNNDSSFYYCTISSRCDSVFAMFDYNEDKGKIDSIMDILFRTDQDIKLRNFIQNELCENNHRFQLTASQAKGKVGAVGRGGNQSKSGSNTRGFSIFKKLLIEYGWQDPTIKETFLKYLNVMLKDEIQLDHDSICHYIDFVSKIKKINFQGGCSLATQLINNLAIKLELNNNGVSMERLEAKAIVNIVKFVLNHGDSNRGGDGEAVGKSDNNDKGGNNKEEKVDTKEEENENNSSNDNTKTKSENENKQEEQTTADEKSDTIGISADLFLRRFEIGYIQNASDSTQIEVAKIICKYGASKSDASKILLGSQFAQNVLKQRMNYLEEQVSQGPPTLCWAIPDKTDTTPGMRQFLHSSDRTWTYEGKFKGIVDARKWASKHSRNYVLCTAGGKGKKAYVTCKKTGIDFGLKKSKYESYVKELKKIKKLILE